MSGSRNAAMFPALKIADGIALVDAVKARGGWVAYAITKNGLRATRIARRSKDAALRALLADGRLKGLETEKAPGEVVRSWGLFLKAAEEGEKVELTRVPLDSGGLPEFTRRVYRRVQKIPHGRTLTYGQVAKQVGRPGAARAVGQVMARNCVAPVVPCHRVVANDGSLGGFSAPGGVKVKADMLRRECDKAAR